MSASCIYEGSVRHRRVSPAREFSNRLALAYIDLDELPWLLGGGLLRRAPGALRFRRRDYHGDAAHSLAAAVADTVAAQTGARPAGPIRLLTQLRSFGHCFNPVSLYYCMSADGERVDTVLAEVTNTPWRERHAYALARGAEDSGVLEARVGKALHVSPFMAMDHTYTVRASAPGERLSFHIESSRHGTRAFDATLSLARTELTHASARAMAARYPLATVRVLALIYAHAAALKLAGARVHSHPRASSA